MSAQREKETCVSAEQLCSWWETAFDPWWTTVKDERGNLDVLKRVEEWRGMLRAQYLTLRAATPAEHQAAHALDDHVCLWEMYLAAYAELFAAAQLLRPVGTRMQSFILPSAPDAAEIADLRV
jgi:hypothetical protein